MKELAKGGETAGAPDIAGLRRFAMEGDRALTEFFVGREPEIEIILSRVESVARKRREGHPKPAESGAVLITGAPGAGKTALMTHLQLHLGRRKDGIPNALGIAVDLEEFENPDALAGAIRRAVPGDVGAKLAKSFGSFNFSVMGISAGVEVKEPGTDLSDVGHSIILFVDEVQRVPCDQNAPVARVLSRFHLGTHGAPIVLVLAGLAHAAEALSAAGLSRLSPPNGLPLAALSGMEACSSTAKFLELFRVAGDRSLWPELIAGWSEGWPAHLNGAQRALAEELAKREGNLDSIDPTAVKRAAARFRVGYYGQQAGGAFEKNQNMLGHVMASIGSTGRSRGEVETLLAKHGVSLPAGFTPEDAFDAMLYRGLIQEAEYKEYVCPIPSMVSFCVAGTGNMLHRAVLAGDRDRVARLLERGEDTNASDVRGRTPLHIAAEEYWQEIGGMLSTAGADPKLKDDEGRTPWERVDHNGADAQILAARRLSIPASAEHAWTFPGSEQ